jgi:RNA polymerase sigma-70 factor, ECF subfamily
MDQTTFARVAEDYAARLYAVAFRLLGNRHDAEDAVQRALLKSYAARESYSPRWAISTWLYRILTNVCVDELRRRRPMSDVETARVSTPSSAGAIGDRIDVARALAIVPREARVLLALHYVNGLSHRELAQIRGISVNTVKSQLARGKTILRDALERGRHGSARRPAR